jgi:lipid-A-disaccharide synthase-like uncharacterized protein
MVYAVRTAFVAVGANSAPAMGYDQLGKPLFALIGFAMVCLYTSHYLIDWLKLTHMWACMDG